MALAQALLSLVVLCGFCLGFASVGMRVLRAWQADMTSDGEHLLVAIAVGLIITEILIFLIQFTQHIRTGCWAIAVLLCAFLLWEWNRVWGRLKGAFRQMVPKSTLGRALLVPIAIVISMDFLVAMAPLTGSDALHYHFTAQKKILELGFHPLFSDSNSFLCGQHHLLILLGLSLGSEHLALEFIFLGGILTTASLACLLSLWASEKIVAAFSLLFLLTPVVFWQISTSGAPDIFMAFLTCSVVLVLRQELPAQSWRRVMLAGFLTGGIAGAKYTGCLIAAALAITAFAEVRSAIQLSLFFCGSILSGIWPYLRNIAWTGNPVFPFLSARLSPHLVSKYAVIMLASSTGASSSNHLSQLIPFVFLAAVQRKSPGFWDFFGPTVLVLAPLILLGFRNTRAWRVSILVWLLSSLAIFFLSGLPRFLLPVFPIALACVAAGFEAALRKKWTIASKIAGGLIILVVLAGAAGLLMYSKDPLLAAVGLRSRKSYLEQRAQDFQVVEAVNELMAGRTNPGRTMVFVRHLYYLDIPYLNGNPDTSFEVDPEVMQTPQAWKKFFEKKGISYVVRSPDYPKTIAGPLAEMERNGDLMPYAQTEIQNLQGMRIDEKRVSASVVILKVKR